MKIFGSVLILVCLFCISCGSGNNTKQTKEPVGDTANYYPIADFFRQQIEYVDLRDFPMYRLRTIDDKKDSSAISKDEFIAMSKGFMQRVFAGPGSKAAYKETVFEDLSTESYTLNYTATDPAQEVRSIDVLLHPETKIPKRVLMKSQYRRGDTSIIEQLSWKADKSFQLTRSRDTNKGYHSLETDYINWNDR